MPNPFSLPILGASLLGAVVVGLHLGESSIGLINPIYFQAPPLHPRERGAAIDEASLQSRGPAYSQLYGWEQGYAARAADCGNCEALEARDAYAYSARVPYFGGREGLSRHVRQARADLGDQFAEVPEEAASRFAAAERYAHYAISEDEAEPEAEMLTAADEAGFDKDPADFK